MCIERKYLRFAAIGTMVCANTMAARADSIDKQFDSFFSNQATFEAQAKNNPRKQGVVLQTLRDRRGNQAGRLEIGGKAREQKLYLDSQPAYNFTSDFRPDSGSKNTIVDDGDGVLNLRLKF